MSEFKEVHSRGRGSSFKVCHAHLKNGILLHSSLVAGVSFFPRLYALNAFYSCEWISSKLVSLTFQGTKDSIYIGKEGTWSDHYGVLKAFSQFDSELLG